MGVIPISTHQDTVGPLARNVADAAATLTVIAAQDRSDPAYSSQEFQASSGSGDVLATPVGAVEQPTYPRRPNDRIVESDFAAAEILNPDGLQGARLGVWRERTGYSTETDAIFEQALSALQDAGAELIDPVTMPSAEELATSPDELQVLLWELNPGIADYIENYVDADFPIRNLADVVAFNKEHPDEELLWFGQEFLIQSVDKSSLDDKDYLETVVRTQKRGRENGIDAVLSEHNLDAIIAPTGQLAWKIDLIAGDNFKGASSSAAAVAGYPIVSVPAGSQFGLPANISFIGTAFSEAVLIRLAFAFEQATQARITPAFLAPRVIPPVT
jgi:amidase